jgi:hypothetical protein
MNQLGIIRSGAASVATHSQRQIPASGVPDITKFAVNLSVSANWHEFCFSLFEPVFPAQPRLKPPFDGDIRCS